MPALLLLIFAAALPALDIALLVVWLFSSPLTGVPYALLAAAAGAVCIKTAKVGFAEMFRRLQSSAANPRALVLFGKMWAVGALLLFPGYLSDIAALAVLLFVRPRTAGAGGNESEDDFALRGELSDPENLEDKRE